MSVKKLLQSKKAGFAMAVILIALVILLAIGGGLLGLGLQSSLLAVRNASDIAARCAADAGLTKAIFEMNAILKANSWNDSTPPQATDEALWNSGATFSYTVADSNSGYILESIGKSGQAERKVSSTLRLQGLFEYGIFTQGLMDLKMGTTIDWYNFDADDALLKIGTSSTAAGAITAKLGVTINGDIVVGVGGDTDTVIDSQNEATITGETYAATEDHQLSPITVPQWLQSLPSQGTITSDTTITTSAKYDGINLGNGEIITINGAVTLYILGDVILDNSAQILIVDANTNPDASLTLYLGGNLETKNGSIINNSSQDPQKLKIYGLDSCTNIDFRTSSAFYGAVYAPNADVRLHNSVVFYGALVSKSFIQDVNADFHYDASLRDVTTSDVGVQFVVKRWREQ